MFCAFQVLIFVLGGLITFAFIICSRQCQEPITIGACFWNFEILFTKIARISLVALIPSLGFCVELNVEMHYFNSATLIDMLQRVKSL